MNKRKPKPKITKSRLEFDVFRLDLQTLKNFAGTDQGKSFGIYPMPDGNGVTFGDPLSPEEHIGEGLPELDGRERLDQWHLDLDIRTSFDHSNQTIYLEISRKGSGRFHKIEFTAGLEFGKAQQAAGRFNNIYEMFLINYGCHFLMQNLIWEQSEDASAKEIALKSTVKSFEYFFKSLLKPSRFREIGKVVEGGLTITTSERINAGRNPGTKGRPRKLSEREEIGKASRKSKIVSAMHSVIDNENKTELSKSIGITVPTFNRWLKSIGVVSKKQFYDLIREAENE